MACLDAHLYEIEYKSQTKIINGGKRDDQRKLLLSTHFNQKKKKKMLHQFSGQFNILK
jgi:hypothetical protein